MFIDLSDKNIVVAGGGNIATRRVKTLLKFTRNITVVATKVTQELMDLGKAGTVTLLQLPMDPGSSRRGSEEWESFPML